ncbi:MAG TPA: helix-turn-helix transcriptional regulator [Candidatus Caccovicinus merdipullorum]|uniref:Helix-turn-helix transcriptional regulator n=1 Tax=Candidatus Caccovicinus merdipullorum TaxID=2840724 RepID=A0A9D1GKW1_9FIRM|nr:helix-turn-helix transcriptional regulator [Candidatus Caccovicinus merdipullorum]
MNERIKELRKTLGLNQTEFGNRIGIKQGSVAAYESGARVPIDAVVLSICREFNVNESWLRTGEGEMFIQVPEEDETAALVYSLLGPEKNEFYTIILEIIRSYQELSPASQQVILDYAKNVLKNLQKKNED